jgi:hypothetical protein
MKPITTYLALLATSSAATIANYHLGMQSQGITTGVCGMLALFAFQGKTQFHQPYWAAGIEIQPPPTGHVLAVAIILEATAIGIGLASGSAAIGITSRILGLVIQAGTIGKLHRDYTGDEQENIEAAVQDSKTATKTRP